MILKYERTHTKDCNEVGISLKPHLPHTLMQLLLLAVSRKTIWEGTGRDSGFLVDCQLYGKLHNSTLWMLTLLY